jgi:hypothetical protein
MADTINSFFEQLRSEINKSKPETDHAGLISLDNGVLKIDLNQMDNKFNEKMQ